MLIAQITDLHIGQAGSEPINEGRLHRVVDRLIEIGPDVVVATGDLSSDGSADSYTRTKSLLAPLPMPVWPAIGNHDRPAPLARAFGGGLENDGFVQYATDLGDLRLVVLDTTETGRHGGAFCERRAGWLRTRLDERPGSPTLIALHHPPIRTGIAWMDQGADGPWSQRLAEVLEAAPQVIGLIAGHLHRPISAAFAGHPLIIASSCAPQVALDFGPQAGDGTATRLPRIVAEEPGFALHLWAGGRMVSHFARVEDAPVVASYDVPTGQMVAG